MSDEFLSGQLGRLASVGAGGTQQKLVLCFRTYSWCSELLISELEVIPWDSWIRSFKCFQGFPGSTSSKEPACQCWTLKRLEFHPWVGKVPLGKGVATHSRILAWRILWAEEPGELVHGFAKGLTRLKWLNSSASNSCVLLDREVPTFTGCKSCSL